MDLLQISNWFLQVNVKFFKRLGGGTVKHKVVHPNDPERCLFLSYDPCHLIKNVRSAFLDEKRNLLNDGEAISPKFIRQLYDMQKSWAMKPVRGLTYKVVNPSNIEKMNVGRALVIFSPAVMAALKFLGRYSKHLGFTKMEATLVFLEIFYRWFTVNCTSFYSTSSPLVE